MRPSPFDASQDAPPAVARVDPRDGATQVLRDAPVILCISQPLDPESLSLETVSVEDDCGTVPGWLRLSPDSLVVIWGGDRPLRPGILHFVVARGLRDRRGRPVHPHWSRFVPCDLAREDLRL
jgi:hypothetical protein